MKPVVSYDVVNAQSLSRVAAKGTGSGLLEKPLPGTPKETLFLGRDLLQYYLAFDQANGAEDLELAELLVLRDVLQMGRVFGRRPVLILGVCRELVQLPLLIKGNKSG